MVSPVQIRVPPPIGETSLHIATFGPDAPDLNRGQPRVGVFNSCLVPGRTIDCYPSSMKNQAGSRFSEVYDFWSGHLDWLHPAPSDLDAEIRSLCDLFVGADPQQRAQMTESLDGADSYQLQCFANRAAIFGLRTSDLPGLRHGLTAASVVNASTVDPRDRQAPLCRLYYCLFSLGHDADREFDEAAARIEGEMREAVRWVRKRCSRYKSTKDFRAEMVIPVKTQSGAGFIDTWVEPYHPTADLVGSVL
jgi:hypothetical protein